MKKNLFLIFCVVLISCSGISVEEGPEDGAKGRGKTGRGRPDADGKRTEDVRICEGDEYTIYAEDCPPGGEEYTADDEGHAFVTGSGFDFSRKSDEISAPERPVDILFMVNASPSMWYYLQTAFQKRFKSFIPILNKGGLDWRILFTNTDYAKKSSWGRNGKAMKLEGWGRLLQVEFLEKGDDQNIFMYTLTRDPDPPPGDQEGTVGTDCLRPPYCGDVEPLKALKASFATNKHLTREEADFVAIIAGNRDEKAPQNTKAQDIISEFKTVYGSEKRLSVLSLIIRPGDTKCYKKNKDRAFFLYEYFQKPGYGEDISTLAPKTGGGNFSICMKDYSILAETILQNAR